MVAHKLKVLSDVNASLSLSLSLYINLGLKNYMDSLLVFKNV